MEILWLNGKSGFFARALMCAPLASACVRAVRGHPDHVPERAQRPDQNLPGGSGHLQASPRSRVQSPRSEKRGDGVGVRSGHFREQGPRSGLVCQTGRDTLFHREIPGEIAPHPTRLSSTLRLRPEGSSSQADPHPADRAREKSGTGLGPGQVVLRSRARQ